MARLRILFLPIFLFGFPQVAANRYSVPVDTFMLVNGRLLTGNTVYYTVQPSECMLTSGDEDGAFGGMFGGYIDFYELVNDKQVAEIPYVIFSDLRNERNKTNGMVSVHREMVYWSNETVEVTVSVITPDLQLVISVNKFTCTEKKGVKFYTQTTNSKLITKYDSLQSALTSGERVRFATEFRICQGAKMANNIGGEIKAFDFDYVDQNITKLVTTIETLNLGEQSGFVKHILYSETFSNGIIYFTDTKFTPLSGKADDTTIQCYMQQDRPGGSVEYFIV